jgi:hypothetical protein
MLTRLIPLAFGSALLLAAVSAADDPKPTNPIAKIPGVHIPKVPPGFDPAKLTDAKEAEKAAEWIEKEYPTTPRPESVRMLIAILRGSQLDGSDGWFGPAENRFTWAWLAEKCGLDEKAKEIPKDQFPGPAALFDTLDRDGDGKIAPDDLDWSDRSPYVRQANMLNRIFRRLDRSGDGRLSREELDEFFKHLAGDKDHFTADDLRRAMIPRGPAGFGPGDGPSIPVLVRGLFAGEIGSMGEGPKVGDAAPDFTLKTADGKESVRLSKLIGPKPVVLVFGNFTCGPFRGLYPDVEAVWRRHKDDTTFLMVYVREAHPTDGWSMESNAKMGVAIKQPSTFGERVEVAGQFCSKLKPALPVVVDDITDPTGTAYSGMPARLYVIDTHGKVAYKSGRGPFGFKPGEMEQALVMAQLEQNGKKR